VTGASRASHEDVRVSAPSVDLSEEIRILVTFCEKKRKGRKEKKTGKKIDHNIP